MRDARAAKGRTMMRKVMNDRAYADDAKNTTPKTGPTVISDRDLDKVSGGSAYVYFAGRNRSGHSDDNGNVHNVIYHNVKP
jgi:hypothetical protein